jgi:hypothetical protein
MDQDLVEPPSRGRKRKLEPGAYVSARKRRITDAAEASSAAAAQDARRPIACSWLRRMKIAGTVLKAGIPLARVEESRRRIAVVAPVKMRDFRALEVSVAALAALWKEEFADLVKGKDVGIIFSGPCSFANAVAILMRTYDDHLQPVHRLIKLQKLEKAYSAVELYHVLSATTSSLKVTGPEGEGGEGGRTKRLVATI